MIISTVFAAGVIENAPTLSTVLLRVLDFLLSVLGVVAIIGLVIVGLMYLGAAGNDKRLQVAKKSFLLGIIGIVVALGSLIVIKQIAVFFS